MGADDSGVALKLSEGSAKRTVPLIDGSVESIVCSHLARGLPYGLHRVEFW